MNTSPQMIRRSCLNGELDYYQTHGKNGIIYVKTSNFQKDEKTWNDFIEKRNELYKRNEEVIKAAIALQDEDLEEGYRD